MQELKSMQRSLKRLRKDIRAISPLIAALLLIAIAVAGSAISYSWIMSMLGSQSQQAQTQVRIEYVTWGTELKTVIATVRNTGSATATIESISVKKNMDESPWLADSVAESTAIDVASTANIVWTSETALSTSTSYIIKVTCTTGFFYETSSTSSATALWTQTSDLDFDAGTFDNTERKGTELPADVRLTQFTGTTIIQDYIDNNSSDVDVHQSKGFHSDFDAMKSKDGVSDTLLEQNFGGTGTFIIRPNAVGSMTEWTPVGSANNWECVDEATPDEDATYVTTSIKGEADSYNLQDHTTETGSISNVRLYVRARGEESANIRLHIVVDGTEVNSEKIALTAFFDDYYLDWAINPVTQTDWTWTDIDTLEAGFNSKDNAEETVTQLYVVVTHSYTHEVDLELQFTDIADFLDIDTFCIYTGNFGDEELGVDYWNSSSWVNLDTSLTADSWNNYTVSLTSSTYTLRFKGSNETDDTAQDAWEIDAVLLTGQSIFTQYYSSGEFVSQKKDTGKDSIFLQVDWTETQPEGTEINIRIRSAPTEAELEFATWYGPTGTDDYYTNPAGTPVNPIHSGDRWIQYKVYLSTTDPNNTPELEELSIDRR